MIKIVADSGCDIKTDLLECPIAFVPLHLHVEDRVYVDDEALDVDEFIRDMHGSPAGAKSAAPSPSAFMDAYKGEESIFAVTLSSKLSGTYQSAMMAKRMYLEEYGKKFIHVFDSLSASIGEGMIAYKVAEYAKQGLSNIEIVENVNNFIKHMGTYFLLERFDNLAKTGRINPYIAKIASMLNIKPICRADGQGEIEMLDKTRGATKAMRRLVEIIRDNTPDIENRVVGISHVKCYERAVAFKDELIKALRVKDVFITEASGLIAIYANKDGVIVSL